MPSGGNVERGDPGENIAPQELQNKLIMKPAAKFLSGSPRSTFPPDGMKRSARDDET